LPRGRRADTSRAEQRKGFIFPLPEIKKEKKKKTFFVSGEGGCRLPCTGEKKMPLFGGPRKKGGDNLWTAKGGGREGTMSYACGTKERETISSSGARKEKKWVNTFAVKKKKKRKKRRIIR